MLTKFSLESRCEDGSDGSEDKKLYVVTRIDSSWHMYLITH